ncbi:phenylacetate--CoA ligase [Bacillus sp. FJAT-49736]|uniref:phenylacetate--CoA ligase family protein n=1 Tax=Bacillus sp. FJAT-49736 TaxID=2833582 RepID=UPI001BCA03BF|nr:phenylacetate--CoA ligase [Bacillus sp. FJAT-49736]MBS4171774.1 phenylacetate--CoA ligase [Bacillus sp. FJAT-49736]
MILHGIETAERSTIEEQQLHDLQKTIDRVYERVPFYRNKLQEKNIHPSSIKTLDDLEKLPFTTKSDLRANYPFGLFAADTKDIVRFHASSGTSGKPTVVGYTKQDIKDWATIVARAITIAGGGPEDILQNAYGYGLFTGGLGLHFGGEELGTAVIPISGGNTERQISIIEDFKPTILCSTPSYALNIGERMLEMGKNPRITSLKYGIFGAEPWSDEMRHTLEDLFDIKACDIYGLSEVVGPGVAIECSHGQDGLHIAEDHFLVEVIDPVSLEPVPEGTVGELVFTSLKKEALPVIRYRTGDIASLTKTKCICGRTTVRMSRVKGRIDDMIIVRGVNVFPSEIEHHLIQIKELAPHYQLHLHRTSSLDEVELHVEIKEDLYHTTSQNVNSPIIQTLKAEIQEKMKSYCYVTMKVVLLPPKSIQRSEGKAVRIIDHRKQEVNK